MDKWVVLASCTRLVSEHQPRSEEQVSSLLKFMGKHLAKDVLESKSRTLKQRGLETKTLSRATTFKVSRVFGALIWSSR